MPPFRLIFAIASLLSTITANPISIEEKRSPNYAGTGGVPDKLPAGPTLPSPNFAQLCLPGANPGGPASPNPRWRTLGAWLEPTYDGGPSEQSGGGLSLYLFDQNCVSLANWTDIPNYGKSPSSPLQNGAIPASLDLFAYNAPTGHSGADYTFKVFYGKTQLIVWGNDPMPKCSYSYIDGPSETGRWVTLACGFNADTGFAQPL